ncbi:MAG: hypothetical protein ABIK09_21130 [Pseudomonadota bacterium]
MIPWESLGRAAVPGSKTELQLHRRGEDFSIRVDGLELMTSRVHGSEESLAELACDPIARRPRPVVLVGGLGMGFTLGATLARLGPDARVEIVELVPGVVEWNRGPLAHLAGRPLDDPRTTVRVEDIAAVLRTSPNRYDAIMNDVDNGPDGIILPGNRWLYDPEGLAVTRKALRPGGVLTIWSVAPLRGFTDRLWKAGFKAREVRLRDSGKSKGRRHTIWVATNP